MKPSFVRTTFLILALAMAAMLGASSAAPPPTHAAQVIGSGSCGGATLPDCPTRPDNYQIGENSCNGVSACASLKDGVVIGNDSCNGLNACFQAGGTIGNDSCNAVNACHLNGDNGTGTIGDGSCNDAFACENNGSGGVGIVGNNACNGPSACVDNGRDGSGTIGNNACHSESANVCAGNQGEVPACANSTDVADECAATIEVRKLVLPLTDPGRFNLLIDGETFATNVRSGGSTGPQVFGPGAYTVSETAGNGTALGNYKTVVICNDEGGIAAAGSGTSLSVSVAPGDEIVCTFLNTRARGTQRWR